MFIDYDVRLNDIIQLIIRPLCDHTSSLCNGKTEEEENGERVMTGEPSSSPSLPPSLPLSLSLSLRTSQLADKENEIRMPPDLNNEKQPSPSEPITPVTVTINC